MKALSFLFLFLFQNAWAQSQQITESELLDLVEKTPQLQKLEAQISSLNSQFLDTENKFAPQLESSVYYNKTRETPLVIFQPPNEPYFSADLKLSQYTSYGFSYSIGVKGESLTSGDPPGPGTPPGSIYINSSRFRPVLSLSMDLLKNRFGSQTGNQLKSLEAKKRVLDLQKEILVDQLKAQTRKLYWNYNILSEKAEINREILKLTEKLYKDIKRKKRQGFVEKGDLYSAESQLTGQKANISLLEFQIESLRAAISEIFPMLPKNFNLKTVNVTNNLKYLYACISKIPTTEEVPMAMSKFSSQIAEKEKELNFTKSSLESFSAPELRLMGEFSGANVDEDLTDAAGDFVDRARYGFAVGLFFKMPLSSFQRKQKESLMASEKYKIQSETKEIKSKLKATHVKTVRAVKILEGALEDQRKTSSSLEKSFKFKKKQYQQARADLLDVLTEQNKFMASRLNQLDISKVIIETLLDYKSQFQNFKCLGAF